MIKKKETSVAISVVDVADIENGVRNSSSQRIRGRRCFSLLKRPFNRAPSETSSETSPWPSLCRRFLWLLTAVVGLATITAIIYHTLLLSLRHRLSPPTLPPTGLDKIVSSYTGPGSGPSWLPKFSQGIIPKPIHSHNDYWRPVPLFQALALGVTGIEADCHLSNSELYIGHTDSSIRAARTLKTLYLDSLFEILEKQNAGDRVVSSGAPNGVWDVDPSQTMILMTDLKTEGSSTLDAVQSQLAPFREKGWLTHWNGSGIVVGPITHVSSGSTRFSNVINSTFSNSTYRDVFFDAPLEALSSIYNSSTSYYASTSLPHLFGGKNKIPFSGLSKTQMIVVKGQIDKASSLGLVSRYWDIPPWPVNRRMAIWRQLEELGVGMLNADEIEEAARWNWRWCSVLGLHLC